MSFKATLTIEGKSYNLLQFTHVIRQKSERGKVTSGVRGGVITMIIDSTDEELFGSWATSPTAKKNGEIVFDRVDQQSSLQKLEFEDAYATFFFEMMASAYMFDVDAIYQTYRDFFVIDEEGKNGLADRFTSASNMMLDFMKRTGVSNCILLRLSAAKIKLDGIDHKNT